MSIGEGRGSYHAWDLDKELISHGIDPDKFWHLDQTNRNICIHKWVMCFEQTVGNKRFNQRAHDKIAEQKKKDFFRWIKTTTFYKNILKEN